MYRTVTLIFTLIISTFSATRVVGYAYAPTANNMSGIEVEKLTHLIGSFIKSDTLGNLYFDNWVSGNEIIQTLKSAKLKGVVPMIALGNSASGWAMTKSQDSRANFISNIISWCDSNGVDGIDLDLEEGGGEFYPAQYESLAVELREAMPDTMILTTAVGGSGWHCTNWSDKMIEQVNWINVMVYDLALTWPTTPVCNHSTFQDLIDADSYWHTTRKVPREKIVLGLPFYARGYDYDNSKIYLEDAGWGEVGDWNYRDFVDKYSINTTQDSLILEPNETINYPRYDTLNGKAVIYFNSRELIAKKCQWIHDNGVSGAMIWHIPADLPTVDSRSLLGAIDSIFNPTQATIKPFTLQIKSESIVKFTGREAKLTGLTPYKKYRVSIVTANGKLLSRESIKSNSLGEARVTEKKSSNLIRFIKVEALK